MYQLLMMVAVSAMPPGPKMTPWYLSPANGLPANGIAGVNAGNYNGVGGYSAVGPTPYGTFIPQGPVGSNAPGANTLPGNGNLAGSNNVKANGTVPGGLPANGLQTNRAGGLNAGNTNSAGGYSAVGPTPYGTFIPQGPVGSNVPGANSLPGNGNLPGSNNVTGNANGAGGYSAVGPTPYGTFIPKGPTGNGNLPGTLSGAGNLGGNGTLSGSGSITGTGISGSGVLAGNALSGSGKLAGVGSLGNGAAYGNAALAGLAGLSGGGGGGASGGAGIGTYGGIGGGWGIGVNQAAVGLAAYGFALSGGSSGGPAATPDSVGIHSMADMIRSEGAYNAATSDALINGELARGRFMDNQSRWTAVYLSTHRAMLAEHAIALEKIRARNLRHQEESSNRSDLPSRLGSNELNAKNGFVDWPAALMRDAFVTQRADIESLLVDRARDGSTSELSAALSNKTREMQQELRAHIREIVPTEYLEARKFLARLSLEGRLPTE